MTRVPFRIGTTSYIIPADILPNVRYLADRVDDVELVLFEVEEGGSNLPDEGALAQLSQIAAQQDLTYTVHLPLDLQFGDDETNRQRSLKKALQVIAHTRALQPYAYILHVDGRSVRGEFHSQRWEEWRRRTRRVLEEMITQVNEPELLAVENLDGYAPEFWDEVLEGCRSAAVWIWGTSGMMGTIRCRIYSGISGKRACCTYTAIPSGTINR
jgi:sugar phosphate isomerase/epimerase